MNLEHYEQNIIKAKEKYLEIMEGNDDAAILMKWMASSDEYSPYSVFLEKNIASCCSTLEGFVDLYHLLHHALYDDGDITFVKTNYYPVAIFYWAGEPNFKEYYNSLVQEGCENLFEINGYYNNVQEFISAYDQHHIKMEEIYEALEKRAKGIKNEN